MKIPLEGFRRVSKDGNTTVLKHPDGHEMSINHSILSPKMRGEIEALPQHEQESDQPEKLAFGGGFGKGVEASNGPIDEGVAKSGKEVSGVPSKPASNLNLKEKYDKIRKQNETNASGETSAVGQTLYAGGGEAKAEKSDIEKSEKTIPKEGVESGPVSNPGNVPVKLSGLEASIPDEEAAANEVADKVPMSESQSEPISKQYDHYKANSEILKNLTDLARSHFQSASPQDTNITANAAPGADQAAGPVAQSELQPQQPVQPSQEVQAPAVQQSVQQAQPQQSQPSFNSLTNQAQSQINDMQSYITSQKVKNDGLRDAVMAGKIDPNRVYGNMDTGSKIVTAIGLILGGLGGAATGGKNLAVDAMDKIIERDVDAQKADQSNKMNAYKLNLEATHNEEEARNMTVNQLISTAQGQLNKAALNNTTALNAAQIANINQEAEQKKITNAQNSYLLNTLKGDSGPGSASQGSEEKFKKDMGVLRMLKPDFAKDQEAKYLPGIGVASVPIPEVIRTEMNDRKNLSNKLAQLENFSTKYGGFNFQKLDPAIKNQGLALAADAQNAYRSANKQGVFKESESKFVNKIIHDDPSSILSSWNAEPGYNQTRHSNDTTINNLQKSYGVKPFTELQPQQSQVIPDGTQSKTTSGIPVIRKNGQWVKQ